jgi:excisionase family DNA binding protein
MLPVESYPGSDGVETGDFLTVPDVALRLKVSRETVREWLRTEQLTGYNLGGRAGWRVSAREVDRLLSSRLGKWSRD